MIRFCQQRDQYSCGPVALLNIDKFFGRRVAYRHLPRYSKRVDCNQRAGTKTQAMSKVLGRATRKSWKKTKQFLKDGGCIVVQDLRSHGHLYLVIMNYREDIGVVNCFKRGSNAAICITYQDAENKMKFAYRTWYVSKPVYPRNPK